MSAQSKPDPLEELLAMPLKKRIAAIDEDVETRKDRYAGIDAFDLADALEVEQPEQPADAWGFTHYAEKQTVEEFADFQDPVSELVFYLKDHVKEKRFKELTLKFEQLDSIDKPSFEFLKPAERLLIEEAINAEQLEANKSNGMCCVASYMVCKNGHVLCFEGDIEDDGTCLELRTPYDYRDGKFIDLSNCIIEET